jgi:hypothetical protein
MLSSKPVARKGDLIDLHDSGRAEIIGIKGKYYVVRMQRNGQILEVTRGAFNIVR